MKPGIFLIFALTAMTCWGQTADELIAKNLAARGGAEKLRAIRTMQMTGSLSFTDQPMPFRVRAKRPSMIREDIQEPGGDLTRAYDGKVAWQRLTSKKTLRAKATPLTGGPLENLRQEGENAIEGPLLDYAKKGSKVEALGQDKVGGHAVYKLKITTKVGSTITQFLDAETYLEIHEEIERSLNGKTTLVVEDVSDYRVVGGVKFAHKFVSGSREKPNSSTLQFDKMELNVPLADSVFVMPGAAESQ
jgi:outer membrane lipoprotein-sorting protein